VLHLVHPNILREFHFFFFSLQLSSRQTSEKVEPAAKLPEVT
jgi:hypothetical protein